MGWVGAVLAGLLALLCLGFLAALALRGLRKPPAAPESPTPSIPTRTIPPTNLPTPSPPITPAPALQATLKPGEVEILIHCSERCRPGTLTFLDEGDAAVLALDFQAGSNLSAGLPAGSYTYQIRFQGETPTPLPEGQLPLKIFPAVQGSLPIEGSMKRVTFWIFYPDINILTNYK